MNILRLSQQIFKCITIDGISRLGLGLDGYGSRDFEYCKEIVEIISIIQRFLFVVFAGKKQPKKVRKCHKFEKKLT